MRDKTIINVPVYRTNPKIIDNNLFPPTKSGMIADALQKVDKFNCSSINNIMVDASGKNYKLEVVKISASNVAYNKSNLLLFQMTVQKKDFGEEYVETTPSTIIPMSDTIKLGSRSYFFILYPVIVYQEQDTKIKTFWNVFVYDDPNKDSEDFLKVVKNVLKDVLKEQVRNIKYKEFLEEIQGCSVLDNITASVLTIEDVDQNYRAKYNEWIVNARLSKKQNVSFKNLPSEQFQELYESQDVDDVHITRKVFKITQGFKQYTLKRERKQNAKTLQDRFVNTVESCFNETITIGDGEENKIYDVDYIVNNVGPIIHKYIS